MPGKQRRDNPEAALHAILRHPLRKALLRLFLETKDGDAQSPRGLTSHVEESVSKVAYHVRVLASYRAVVLIDTRLRRGAVQHFYRATSLVDDVPWGRTALGLPPINSDDFPPHPSTYKEDSA